MRAGTIPADWSLLWSANTSAGNRQFAALAGGHQRDVGGVQPAACVSYGWRPDSTLSVGDGDVIRAGDADCRAGRADYGCAVCRMGHFSVEFARYRHNHASRSHSLSMWVGQPKRKQWRVVRC